MRPLQASRLAESSGKEISRLGFSSPHLISAARNDRFSLFIKNHGVRKTDTAFVCVATMEEKLFVSRQMELAFISWILAALFFLIS